MRNRARPLTTRVAVLRLWPYLLLLCRSWEIPPNEPAKFWTPPELPGCAGKAVMHADAEPKHYLERFAFRAPPAGTGPITFRALIKQGDTNMGAFYWPTAPASGVSSGMPMPGRAGGDLLLDEITGPPPRRTWGHRGGVGDTCTVVCQAQNLVCDEAALVSTDTASELEDAVKHSFMCSPPFIRTCTVGAPRMSGMGDGLCWYVVEGSTISPHETLPSHPAL